MPRLGLAYADGVCFSEADEAIIDLVDRIARGADWSTTPNFAVKADGTIVTNRALPPFKALDSLPYYDYELLRPLAARSRTRPHEPGDTQGASRDLAVATADLLLHDLPGLPPHLHLLQQLPVSSALGHDADPPAGSRAQRARNSNTMSETSGSSSSWPSPTTISSSGRAIRSRSSPRSIKPRVGLPIGVAFSAKTWRREKLEPFSMRGFPSSRWACSRGASACSTRYIVATSL